MDSWPGYSEHHTSAAAEEKGKAKSQDRKVESPWRYPVLDHGSLGAASLNSNSRKKGRRYEWTFAVEANSDYKLVPSDGPIEVFPPTRPKPLRTFKATPLQRAEQGAQFIRTYYPDVDIPAELIREAITEDDRTTRASKSNDLFSGNLVDISSFHSSRKNLAYLAFPMGESGCQLNMSPISVHSKTKVKLQPVAAPVHTFETPIRQIVASPQGHESTKGITRPMLAVRTMGATSFMQVKVAGSRNPYAPQLVPTISVERSNIGDKHAMDVALPPANSGVGYVVNELGEVYRCSAQEERTVIECVHNATGVDGTLCRVAACEVKWNIVTTYDNTASLLDLRAGKQPYELYTIPAGQCFTSAESPTENNTVCLVSTGEILWVDQRYTRRPLLAVKHHRNVDFTLRSQTRILTNSHLTFLTSRTNSLVTVYDVSRGAEESDRLVHMYGEPYALPPLCKPDGPHLGYAFYQQPTLVGSKHLSVFQLSARGGVSLLNLDHLDADAVPQTSSSIPRRAEWPPEVETLGEEADSARVDRGPLAARAHSIVNLGSAYEKIFIERKPEDLSLQTNTVLDTLERMPTVWQDTDAPVEHVLTTFDIAMRAGLEPSDASRNDWLTGSTLDTAAGYRALKQGRIPRDELAKRSPWHFDLSSCIRRHVPEYDDDPQKTMENLVQYDLGEESQRTADSFRREKEARSQLALDLALAADVFSPRAPAKDAPASFDDDMLSISLSTQAMTLEELTPPHVQFGFLRPIQKADADSDAQNGDEADKVQEARISTPIAPLGVRLLLQEWELGSDPMQYVYRDPYDGDPRARDQAPPSRRTRQDEGPPQRPPAITSVRTQAQAPPVVAASQPRRPFAPGERTQDPHAIPQSQGAVHRHAGSQPTDTWGAPPSSQDAFASTQVLPGPHGGRAGAVKKKPAKKRLGGF